VYQNTFFNSVASFERNERSAVGDHFGWHPSTGPDVDARHGHVFVNNVLAADETFKGPLLQFQQSAAVKDRAKDSQVSQLDGNVYVRRAGTIAQPLVAWSPVQNERGSIDVKSLDELRALPGKFEANGNAYPDYRGPLFRSIELGNFELLADFPSAKSSVATPAKIRELLGWKETSFPGAYLPLR
jgi:hypothetical protein